MTNHINWNYQAEQEVNIKTEQAERSRQYKMFLAEHPLFQRPEYETVKTQIYFSFMQDADPNIIHYFFDEKNTMSSVDIDCYRLLAVLYSLDSVKNELTTSSSLVSAGEIHEFIYRQELMRHQKQEEAELPVQDQNVWQELLEAINRNTEAHGQYDTALEACHQKELAQIKEAAVLREQLAELKASSEKTEEMLQIKIENEKIKAAKEKEDAIQKLQMDIVQREKETEALNNRIAELQHESAIRKMVEGSLNSGTPAKKRAGPFYRKRKNSTPELELMKHVLQSQEYPAYQIEFIGQCYMEDMSADEMQYLQKPGLPLENLQVMKTILLAARKKE
jgi:hypothetical protein